MTCLCLFSAQVWSYLLALILHGELVLIPGNSSLQGTRYIHGLAFSFLAFFLSTSFQFGWWVSGRSKLHVHESGKRLSVFSSPAILYSTRISGGFHFLFFPLDDLCCFNFFMLVVVVGGAAVVVKMILSGLRYLYLGHWERAQKNANNITL